MNGEILHLLRKVPSGTRGDCSLMSHIRHVWKRIGKYGLDIAVSVIMCENVGVHVWNDLAVKYCSKALDCGLFHEDGSQAIPNN